jgi:hypothetical protein
MSHAFKKALATYDPASGIVHREAFEAGWCAALDAIRRHAAGRRAMGQHSGDPVFVLEFTAKELDPRKEKR